MKSPLLTNIWHEILEIEEKEPVSRIHIDFYNPSQAKIDFYSNLSMPNSSTLIFTLPDVRLNMPPLILNPLDGIINDLRLEEQKVEGEISRKHNKGTKGVKGVINIEHPVKYHFKEEKKLLHRITLEFERKIFLYYLKDKKILIDPGHGGKDRGSISPVGLTEKDVVLDFSLRLKKYLQYWQAEVILTREKDINPSTKKRIEQIKNFEADLVISLHTGKGPTGEVLGPAAKYYKDSQNKGEKDARYIYRPYASRLPFPSRGVAKSSAEILSASPERSFIIEIANISSRLEEGWLRDYGFVEDMVRGLVVGIKNYFSKHS